MADTSRLVQRTLSFLERTIEAMAEAVIVVDRTCDVVAVNDSAVSLLDLPNKAAALRPLVDYDRLVASWSMTGGVLLADALRRSFRGETISRQTATISTAAGRERIIQFTITPVRDEQGQVLLVLLVALDRTEDERTRTYWRVVGTAARGLTTDLNVDRVLESVLDQIVESLGGQVVLGIWRLDRDGQRLLLRICRGISEPTMEKLRSLPFGCPSFICEAISTRQVRYIEDTRKTPPRGELDRRLVEDEQLLSWVGAPLLVSGRPIGAIAYGLRTPRRFYDEDVQAILTISELFAAAIDHAELYQESQRQRQELEQERDLRTRFTAAVAHDLRGPLTVLKGNAQLLARSARLPVERQERLLRSIGEQVDRLERMTRDLMDVSRIASGRFTIEREPVDLAPLFRRVVADVQRSAPSHRLRLHAPEHVRGDWDPSRVVQVLENLLTNAVKFSPAGGEVVVRVAPRKDDVLVRVTDEGVGIAREQLDELFQPFTRVAPTPEIGGTGLGLFIARSIVEGHRGRIWAESPGPGRGTTISFTLPFH